MKIERDQSRFQQIVRGKIRENLRKYVTHGEMIGRKGRDLVSIPDPAARRAALPLRQERLGRRRPGRRRRRARPSAGGEARAGQGPGRQRAGRAHPGSRSLARRAGRDPGRRAGAAAHRAQGQGQHRRRRRPSYTSIRRTGPGVAAALQADLHARRCGGRSRRTPTTPIDPRVVPIREDKRYRSWKTINEPEANAVDHLHDGRLRLDDRRAEGDRPHRGLLDRHLAAEPVRRRRDALHHPRCGGQGSRRGHVLSHPRKRRHADQLGLQGVRRPDRRREFPPSEWNIYCFQFSDGDNWGEDNEQSLQLLRERHRCRR